MARSEQSVAAAALPTLLPTPPRSKMVPLLPTPCLIILPASFASPSKPKPGRADAVERWDAHKTGAGGAPPLTKRRAADRGRGLCRADACDRWDSNKTSPSRSSASSPSSSSPSRSRSGRSRSPARSSSSRASSDERWDIHKKPRVQAGALDAEKSSEANAVMIRSPATARAEFAGPSFVSPEPSMLPLPMFLMARCSDASNLSRAGCMSVDGSSEIRVP